MMEGEKMIRQNAGSLRKLKLRWWLSVIAIAVAPISGVAAQGEMGTGVPSFGIYLAHGYIKVWAIKEVTVPFPAECSDGLVITQQSVGAESYKAALALLTAAKISGQRVRFFSHSENGCSADYLQIED